MSEYSVHHAIRLADGGEDKPYNRIRLHTATQHNHIHNILGNRDNSLERRNIKFALNEASTKGKIFDILDCFQQLQKIYFSDSDRLPKNLQQIHEEKFLETKKAYEMMIESLLKKIERLSGEKKDYEMEQYSIGYFDNTRMQKLHKEICDLQKFRLKLLKEKEFLQDYRNFSFQKPNFGKIA